MYSVVADVHILLICDNSFTTTLSQQKCQNSSVTTAVSQQPCHNSSVTTTVSQEQCHNSSVTTAVSQQQCHNKCHNSSVTTAVSQQQCHKSSVTTAVSKQQCHNSSVTTSVTTAVSQQVSQQQCHNSKYVIFQVRFLNVLKCCNFLWVQRRHSCSPAASFTNCVMTLYLFKSASAYVSWYINNSKMPNFELWQSCRKWAIYGCTIRDLFVYVNKYGDPSVTFA